MMCSPSFARHTRAADAIALAGVRRVPRHRRIPIARAFALYEYRNEFTAECLADMLSIPLPIVRERIELLEAA